MASALRALLIGITLALSIPSLTHAQLIDPRCFTQEECTNARRSIKNDATAEEGFYTNGEAGAVCGEQEINGQKEKLGFCLPVGKTTTQISFGGKTQFNNLGEFIQYGYRYGILIAGILSVLMIIFGGFQWAMSGGNSSTIENAKKRIGGAVIGLAIAVLSYTILYIINPNLVNLRLPEIWMVNTARLAPTYCTDDEKSNKMLAEFRPEDKILSLEDNKKKFQEAAYDTKKENGKCGTLYFIQGSGGQFCRGTACPSSSNVCAPAPELNRANSIDRCYDGDVVVNVKEATTNNLDVAISNGWEDFPFVDPGETELHGLCNDGKTFEISTTDRPVPNEAQKIFQFILKKSSGETYEQIVQEECGSKENFRGFYLILEILENWDVTDEDHYIGRGAGNIGKDLGDDVVFEQVKLNDQVKPYLIPLSNFDGGKVRFDLNINEVFDIDNTFENGEPSRKRFYKELGY